MGYDLALGLELNIKNMLYIDFGVKWIKTYGVEFQLGPVGVDLTDEQSFELDPEYLQYYVGINFSP